MGKLKVQMNFGGINWDDDMVTFCIENLKNVDSILLGRITADAFIPYWKEVAKNPNPNDINHRLGKPINEISKVIFSNNLKTNIWENTTIIKGAFEKEIKNLKGKNSKGIIVYGGNSFVSALVEYSLVDEYYLFMNPLAICGDEPILKFINSSLPLQLKECKTFGCGTLLLKYIYLQDWSVETKNITVL